MSEEAEIDAFRRTLTEAFEFFRSEERHLRTQYARQVQAGDLPPGADDDELLERPTRRFLVDRMLRGLDWNPDNPNQVMEEARNQLRAAERLYFDYLGVDSQTRVPVILVEAKAFDAGAPRRPRGVELDAREMARLISGAIADLKSGKHDHPILAQWAEWLRDLQNYVVSLDRLRISTLKRVVLTAGRWMVIFEDPIQAFVGDGVPNIELIHCFLTLEDILDRHALLFRLLQRQRLVDTLPLMFSVAEAHAALNPQQVSAIFRGIYIVTRESGGTRRTYPTRSVWPALIAISSGRPFAIIDDAGDSLEDPRDLAELPEHITRLSARGADFQGRVLQAMGRAELRPGTLHDFPGFSANLGRPALVREEQTIVVANGNSDRERGKRFLIHVGSGYAEFIMVTGETWHFKAAIPHGPECELHFWPRARARGVSAQNPVVGRSEDSYTESGDPIHCAHEELRGMRFRRCQVAPLESHLCCRACNYFSVCWEVDQNRLPCPN